MSHPKLPDVIRRPDLDTKRQLVCFLVMFAVPIIIIGITYFL